MNRPEGLGLRPSRECMRAKPFSSLPKAGVQAKPKRQNCLLSNGHELLRGPFLIRVPRMRKGEGWVGLYGRVEDPALPFLPHSNESGLQP